MATTSPFSNTTLNRFDLATQMALVWVRVPLVNPQSADQKVFLYFGNDTALPADSPSESFDPDMAAVFHFSEASGLPVDSSAFGSVVGAAEVFPNSASLIGSGVFLTGTSAMRIEDAAHLRMAPEKGWSFSVWLKVDALPEESAYVMERPGADGGTGVALQLGPDGLLNANYGDGEVQSTSPLVAGQWYHLALTLGDGQLQLYVDGATVGGVPVTLEELTGPIFIGASANDDGALTAALDELQIASTARSADYLAFSASVQGQRNDAVLSYLEPEASGAEGEPAAEEHGGGHMGHFGIIIQNVFGRPEAIIEQLVIGVCVLMMAIAMLVMLLKGIWLGQASSASRKFNNAYSTLTGSDGAENGIGALVDEEKKFGDSPLFRVYREGITQLRARVSPAVGADNTGLSPKALAAIRATLDSVMVRESQRLNSLLVLLTIAISGGPFIGLLGTVVGVMITFAAIAATGDVNIAAIAPGMAAALLATVAGLGVAIPSLFGYNYLGSQVKSLSADMSVFADEFMARITEQYGA